VGEKRGHEVTVKAAGTCEVSIGDIRLTYIPDGSIQIPPTPMFDGGTQELFDANSHLLDDEGYLVMSLGSLLVETAGKRVLVDLAWGPSSIDIESITHGTRRGHIVGGGLIDSLAARGLQPSDIDAVLFSHLHRDHVGWLVTDKPNGPALTFDRAEYFLAEPEWQFWSAPENEGRSGGPTPGQLDALANRVEPLEEGRCPVAGIDVLFTPGHTPGHCSFVISSGNERAVVMGDTIHCALEISHPELALLTDVDPGLGIATRTRIQRELDEPNTVTVGSHFPDAVFGRVLTGAAGRRIDFLPPHGRVA
jgi:glyoxylase-like metal-dependent hydrolase (beta-lactamase superfamily II)